MHFQEHELKVNDAMKISRGIVEAIYSCWAVDDGRNLPRLLALAEEMSTALRAYLDQEGWVAS